MINITQENSSLDVVSSLNTVILRIIIICTILETIFFYDQANIYGCLALLLGYYLNTKFVLNRDNLIYFPIPTIALFGYIFCYFFLPLPVTLLEGKPITFNFEFPYITFSNQILNVIVLILSFNISKRIYKPNNVLTNLWRRFGYYDVPTERNVWIVGMLGLLAVLYYAITHGNEDDANIEATSSLFMQLLNIFKPMAYFPLCIVFSRLYGSVENKSKRKVIYYILALCVIGIATTRRTIVFSSVLLIFVMYIYTLFVENKTLLTLKSGILYAVIFLIVSGPLTDLATAMILNRHSLNGSQTFSQVLELYNNKEQLHTLQQLALQETDNQGDNSQGWSEYYVNNIFLDRFCNLRVQDATISYAKSVGYGSLTMQEYKDQFFINLLPSFIVNELHLSKNMIYTATDLMVATRMNRDSLNYGWRVGGDTGIGLSVWGYWYYLVALLTYILLFYFMGSLVRHTSNGVIIPLHALASLATYFLFFQNGYGIFASFKLLFRGGWQSIIVYCVIMGFIRAFNRLK